MSNINFSDLELLSNRKKLSKYFDKEKLSQNIQIEQIIGQINNISKNDQEMPLNLNLNESLKNNLEVLINTYYKINEEVKLLADKIGQLGEARMILLAALVLLDKFDDSQEKMEEIIKQTANKIESVVNSINAEKSK